MKAIVCVDKNWGIGKDGKLLVNNKIDMEHFKKITMNKNIVMGRKTLDSFKNGNPLPNRTNIVLSKSDLKKEGVISFKSIENLLKSSYNNNETFVIGGGQIYNSLLNSIDYIYVTKMENEFDADTFFPNLDNIKDFEIVNKSQLIEYNGIIFRFLEYKRKSI